MLDEFAAWLKDLLLWVPLKLWETLLAALSAVLNAIPAPDFVSNAGGYFGSIPAQVIWVLNLFAVPEGVAMILGALTLRFIVRRIPIIG